MSIVSKYLVILVLLFSVACGRTGLWDYPPRTYGDAGGGGDAAVDLNGPDPLCGDGILQRDNGEECDDGLENDDEMPDACRTNCRAARCGDGVTDSDDECDDGNGEDEDFCSNDCLLVPDDPCSPCEVDDDCARPQDLCVDLLDGRFCALECSSNQPCPDGYSCDPVLTENGQMVDQCLPEFGVCAGCLDEDGDGFGVGAECLGVDCDDTNFDINPLADEWCNGIDDDCDFVTDEPDALDALTWYADRDGDLYGDPDSTTPACEQPRGFVEDNTDCDDTRPDINPAATEICDDIDNNCNTENDEGCPPDLIIDGEQVAMSGDFLFDRVEILNEGQLRVTPFDGEPGRPGTGTPGTGCVGITARVIFIREDSGINATGSGGAGDGPGDAGGFGRGLRNSGPGGGGYGGRGGSGAENRGGDTYGTSSGEDIEMGSNGGPFLIESPEMDAVCSDIFEMNTDGGVGGGCVWLEAPAINVWGYVRADGRAGENGVDSRTPNIVDGGGGGSGGGIGLSSPNIRLHPPSTISAQGGPGGLGATYDPGTGEGTCIGNGGGGGGGGRIKLFGRATEEGRVVADGGVGGTGPQSDATDGEDGTLFSE